jgi:hypothetical protein
MMRWARPLRSFLVLVVLVVALLATASPALAFPDVRSTDWFAGSLQALVDAGIVDDLGQPFRPGDPITRAEFASMIRRSINPPMSTEEPFTDVGPNDWFHASVASLFQAYVINGTTATTFSPHKAIERQAAASLVIGALN